jgi:hypothetical protein
MTERPHFELQSYEDATLPCGERLEYEEDLKGHTIKAVITHLVGRLGEQADMVIVTETLCWLVLGTSDVYGCDERPIIEVQQSPVHLNRGNSRPMPAETLHDYLGAAEMLHHGLITSAQHAALELIEQQEEERKVQNKAAELRRQLAELEGGAA